MPTVSSLIEFLMNLLRDEAAQAEFERDPQATLTKAGLDGLCGQDIHDVYPLVADHPAVHPKTGDHHPTSHHPTSHDPVQAITHLTQHHEINQTLIQESHEYNLSYIDDRDTLITVDDRDTTTINADGDVTIEDSFNQDNDVNVIEDSFNQDNDGIDNKNGTITESTAAGDDIENSLNTDDDTTLTDSLNTDNSHTNIDASDDDTTHTTLQDSFTTDDDGTDIDLHEDAVPEAQPV